MSYWNHVSLGQALSDAGACFDPFGDWFYFLAWNLAIGAMLCRAEDRGRAVVCHDRLLLRAKPHFESALESRVAAGVLYKATQ